MFEIIHESGFAAWVSLLIAFGGVFAVLTLGRRRRNEGMIAALFAVAILASGAVGVGMGQTKVYEAAESAPDLTERVALLNEGTKEAHMNLLFSGGLAMSLLGLGGVLALRRKELTPAP